MAAFAVNKTLAIYLGIGIFERPEMPLSTNAKCHSEIEQIVTAEQPLNA